MRTIQRSDKAARAAMVFHCPFPVSGSTLHSANLARPVKMLAAFKQAGYEVVEISGHGKQRSDRIKEIKRLVSEGLRIEFVYSESSNLPLFFGEPDRIPRYPFLEYRFFQWLRKRRVPTGLFLRDLHWRFPHFRSYPLYKRLPAVAYYWLDWLMYQSRFDCLFLPSLRLRDHLPTQPRRSKISALPAGCDVQDQPPRPGFARMFQAGEGLSLLYVGGVTPPLYDLSPFFKCARVFPDFTAVLCCRKDEWMQAKSMYDHQRLENVRVVHESGPGLAELYRKADLFALLWKPYHYLNLIVPYKVFEALGYQLPIITLEGTEAARLVEEEGLGWVGKGLQGTLQLLEKLRNDRSLIADKRALLWFLAVKHSWTNRARAVAEALGAGKAAK